MVSRSVLIAAAAAPLLALAQSGPTIGSPALYACTPAAFVYACDSPPCSACFPPETATYSLLAPRIDLQIVVRPSDDQSKSIANLGSVNDASGSASWTVSEPEGSSVTVWITDSKGVVGNNAATTVAAGSGDCASGSSGSFKTDSATSTGAGASASTKASSAASGASSAVDKATGSASSSSSAPSSTSSPDADSGARSLVAGGFAASALALAAYLA
ncbi:hypothetical protein JCM10213v2_002183 [Rhodosporidiobolus nylandii]